ncbi:DUF3078 domain-containing protein [bacterium]|nr:DUF3078 domain-containing protein [bacterium]
MKKLILVFFLIIAVSSFAQEAEENPYAWKTSVEASLSMTQAAYSDNWTGGEVGSIVWASNLHGIAQKQLSDLWKWENDLKLAFGQTHNQNKETKQWSEPDKSTDKIRFDSILKLTLNSLVDPYAAFVLESQWYDASSADKNLYFSPLELTESAGASRTWYEKGTERFATRLGFGLRQYFVKVYDPGTEETTTETANDGGIEFVADYMEKVNESLSYTSKLTLFQALFYSESDADTEDLWKSLDMAWENILTARVTKIVQVSLAWELVYDEQQSNAGQFKETLALGVGWVF